MGFAWRTTAFHDPDFETESQPEAFNTIQLCKLQRGNDLTLVYQIAAIFLLLNIGAGLIRVLMGPTTADRLLSVQLFGTTGTTILILLSLETNNESFQNVALIFALLASILGVTFTQYVQSGSNRQGEESELNHELE